MLTVLISSLPILVIFLLLGIAMKVGNFDPNGAIGYRTKRSRQSKEVFDYANKIFWNYLIYTVIISFIIDLIAFFALSSLSKNLQQGLITVFILIPVVILLIFIPITENKLKKKFEQ